MSSVTNIMVTGPFDEYEEEVVEKALKVFTGEHVMPFLKINEERVGGTKCLESTVYIAALNHMNVEYFCDIMYQLRHELDLATTEDTQIIIKTQGDYKWHVHTIDELEADCFYQRVE